MRRAERLLLNPKEDIILVGGGGHCTACIDVIEAEGRFRIAGIIDVREKLHSRISGYEIIGTDEDLPDLMKTYGFFLVTIGQVRSPETRATKYNELKRLGAKLPTIISPSAYVSKRTELGEGTIIMHRALVNANAKIGNNCILNSGSVIEHDVIVGDHCHISTCSIVNGDCSIGNGVFIGSNSTISHQIQISSEALVGAGSVVVSNIEKLGTYAGNPARLLHE